MLSTNNILKPADGKPVTMPTQDMITGIYCLTRMAPDTPGTGRIFGGLAEALMAYDRGDLDLQAEITVRLNEAAAPAGFAAPELVRGAGTAPAGLALPPGDAAAVATAALVPVFPAAAEVVPVAPPGAGFSAAAEPAGDGAPGAGWPPALSWRAAAWSRPSSRRFPQAPAPAVITASTAATATRRQAFRPADVFTAIMSAPPF